MAAFTFVDLDNLRSVEDLTSYQKSVRERLVEMDAEKDGLPFSETEREEFQALKDTDASVGKRVEELRARKTVLEGLVQNPKAIEQERDNPVYTEPDAKGTIRERDIYDLSRIRMDLSRPEVARQMLHDRARRAIEVAKFALSTQARDVKTYGYSQDAARAHAEALLDQDNDEGDFARYLIATGDPAYRRAYTKMWRSTAAGLPFSTLTVEEQLATQRAVAAARALTLGTTGIPLPFTLDPTLIPVSAGSVNPIRAIASVEQVVTNVWKGATNAGVTAAYVAAGTEATDGTPTLAQPAVTAHRAQVFIPMDAEVEQDWGAVQSALARSIADAKDDLEATKFNSGGGTNEPYGIDSIAAGRNTQAGGTGAFAAADLYALEAALDPRFRARASICANRAIYQKVRAFDTNGGAQFWMNIAAGLPNAFPTNGALAQSLLGYPTYEWSTLDAVLTTGSRIMLMGDFSYYKVIDRVGMSIELIPHLFGTVANYPTGQRGVYGYWRNGAAVLSETAFRYLITG